jgi:hypothetical protein
VASASGTSSIASSVDSHFSSVQQPQRATAAGINKPTITVSEKDRLRQANPALLVLTHPYLEPWHRLSIRTSVGEYGIGVIFVPLYEDQDEDDEEELPVLRPLDPRTMTSFPTSFADLVKKSGSSTLDREMKLRINLAADVESKIPEIIDGVKDIMGIDE